MATTAQYAATPRTAVGSVSTANTARNGTGTIATIFTGGTNGSRIDDITVIATGTVTAGVVRLFLNDGTTSYLLQEIMVTATTPSTTVQTFTSQLLNQSIITAIYLPISIFLYYLMVIFEEKDLVRIFGSQYMEYSQIVKHRIIPYIL